VHHKGSKYVVNFLGEQLEDSGDNNDVANDTEQSTKVESKPPETLDGNILLSQHFLC